MKKGFVLFVANMLLCSCSVNDNNVSDTAWAGVVCCGDFIQGGAAGSISQGANVVDVIHQTLSQLFKRFPMSSPKATDTLLIVESIRSCVPRTIGSPLLLSFRVAWSTLSASFLWLQEYRRYGWLWPPTVLPVASFLGIYLF